MGPWIKLVLAIVCAAGCRQPDRTSDRPATGGTSAAPTDAPVPAWKDINSNDILARTETESRVFVKDVLISWKGLAVYAKHQDPRGAARTNEQAAALAQEVLGKLQAHPELIDELVRTYSEEPTADSGEPFEIIKSDSRFAAEFKALAVRLKVNEAGIVRTLFGYHVIERIVPKPDPVESTDILARTTVEKGVAYIRYVLIGWKGGYPGARGATHTKAEADKLARDVLSQMKKGADLPELMKRYSEDPNSKDDGKIYEVSTTTQLIQPFKNLALRLKVGEAGIVKSSYGFHVMKRLPPPPPDPLESADILARDPTTEHATVKDVLLGWTEFHSKDPRGAVRTRAELEQLVKATLARLASGEAIEPIMKELSEDSNTAADGKHFEVTPDNNLIDPFKRLSLRLQVGEIGVVKSMYGIHIIQRQK